MESPEYSGMSCAVEVGKVYTCLRLDQCQKAVVLSDVIQIEITEDSCSENESGNSKLMKAAKVHCESEKNHWTCWSVQRSTQTNCDTLHFLS